MSAEGAPLDGATRGGRGTGVKLQRFSLDGAVGPSWPSGGLLIAQPVDAARA
jgi:hypothetical protein